MEHPRCDGFSEYRWPLLCSFCGDDDVTTPRPRLMQPTTPLSSPPGCFAGLNRSTVRRRSIASSVRSRSKSAPGTVVPHLGTVSFGAPVVDRSVPFLYMGNGNAHPRMINRGAAIQPACGTAGRPAPATRAPHAGGRSRPTGDRAASHSPASHFGPEGQGLALREIRGAGVSSGQRLSDFRGAT